MFWRARHAVVVGGRYAIPNQKGDPCGERRELVMTVTDIKDGWVRYRMNDLPGYDVMPLEEFAAIYKLVA